METKSYHGNQGLPWKLELTVARVRVSMDESSREDLFGECKCYFVSYFR
jgi:hypothetical protein